MPLATLRRTIMKCVKCSSTFGTMILLLAGFVQADESGKK